MEAFDRLSTEEIVAAFRDRLEPIDGVELVVEQLHAAGLSTCVASSGSHRKMKLTLGTTGLHDVFEHRVFSASEVDNGKPAPDLFLRAARRMNVEPSRAVVVEGSVSGVLAAGAAGMRCFGYAGGLTPAARLEAAGAVVFQHMSDLAERLIVPD